jgi:hypothetical protein
MKRFSHWLIPLPAILYSFYPLPARAEPTPGLTAIGYTIPSGIPIKSDTQYQSCGTETENNINRNFDGEPFQQCPNDWFMIHYTGYINIPKNESISFMIASDDGGTMQIGETAEFGTWNLKGCQWSTPTLFVLPEGQYPLDGWFFEGGGYACYMLAWSINGANFVIVPNSAFTTQVAPTTTTTSSTTTSSTTTSSCTTTTSSTSTTTTTVEPSTTTTLLVTTTVPTTVQIIELATTSIPAPTSTIELPTTTRPTTATTIYIPPITTPVVLPVQEPIVIVPTATTTTIEVMRPIETTLPVPVSTSIPKIDIPLTTDTRPPATVPPPIETTAPPTSITVPYVPRPTPSAVGTTLLTSPAPTSSSVVETTTPPPLSTTPVNVPSTILQSTDPLPVTIPAQASNEQITQLVSSPETLKALTVDQAEQLFEQLDVTELDNTELEAFTEAIQAAPVEVRKAFEKKIDIFGSEFENYVPAGSNIPVSERRSLVAAGALIATGTSTRMRRK